MKINEVNSYLPSEIASIIKKQDSAKWVDTLFDSKKGGKNLATFLHKLIREAPYNNSEIRSLIIKSFTKLSKDEKKLTKGALSLFKQHKETVHQLSVGNIDKAMETGKKKTQAPEDTKDKKKNEEKSKEASFDAISKALNQGATFEQALSQQPAGSVADKLQSTLTICTKLEGSLAKTGLSRTELFKMVYHIEKNLRGHQKESLYLRKEKSKLPRTIEYNKVYGTYFIHLKTHGIPDIGSGVFKTATLSILVDKNNPRLVVNAVSSREEKQEVELLKRVKGVQGVASLIAEGKHQSKKNSQRKKHAIITELCNSGTFEKAASRLTLTQADKLHLAITGAKAIKSLQERNIFHHDLHSKNILIHRSSPQTLAESRIIDFNCARTKAQIEESARRHKLDRRKAVLEYAQSDRTNLASDLWIVYTDNNLDKNPARDAFKTALNTYEKAHDKKAVCPDRFERMLFKMAKPTKDKHKSLSHWIAKFQQLQTQAIS